MMDDLMISNQTQTEASDQDLTNQRIPQAMIQNEGNHKTASSACFSRSMGIGLPHFDNYTNRELNARTSQATALQVRSYLNKLFLTYLKIILVGFPLL